MMNKANEAKAEFQKVSRGFYPMNSEVLNSFSNGSAEIANCSWKASNGYTVLFTVTCFPKAKFSIQVTGVYE
jgi:hypothetical protein